MIYNVLVGVVELVEADTPNAAIDKLCTHLKGLGLEPYEVTMDAFETEPGTDSSGENEGILR